MCNESAGIMRTTREPKPHLVTRAPSLRWSKQTYKYLKANAEFRAQWREGAVKESYNGAVHVPRRSCCISEGKQCWGLCPKIQFIDMS